MENEERGVTLGRVFKVAFTNWKLFTAVSLVTAIVCFLGINFGLNTFRGSYASTFSYSSADLAKEKYADGSDFHYQNLVSYENLNTIKESNEKYSSINIDSIVDNSAINITSDSEQGTYTITLAYRFLKDEDLAKSFIKDITESAIKKDADLVNSGVYDNSLKLFDNADSFEKKINYLNSQATFLKNQYKELANINDQANDQTKEKTVNLPTSVVEQITANNQELNLLIPNSFMDTMDSRIALGGFAMDYSTAACDKLRDTKLNLNKEKEYNSNKVTELITVINSIDTDKAAYAQFSEDIEKLILRNGEIDNEVDAIDAKVAHEGADPASVPGYTNFVNDLNNYRAKLASSVDSYKGVLKAAYIDNASVNFEKTSVVELKGTINIFVNVALSLVVGVVIGAVVNLIVDRKRLFE